MRRHSVSPLVWCRRGSQVTVALGSGQAGEVYYTLDGSDPRLPETPTAPGTPVILSPREGVWEYLDDGRDAGSAWRTGSGGWSAGQAELGFGDSTPENTMIDGGPSGGRYITTYFRRQIEIADASAFSSFKILLRRDDGAVVYVNGVEVARSNLPAMPAVIDHLTRASSSVSGTAESIFLEIPIGSAAFVDGTNALAVEVHQDRPTSSDLSFDLALVGISGGGGGTGGPSANAVTTPNPIPLEGIVTVRARSLNGGVWSPISQATFIVGGETAAVGNLAIAEINYHPREAQIAFGETGNNFEFIELANIGSKPIDLAGCVARWRRAARLSGRRGGGLGDWRACGGGR